MANERCARSSFNLEACVYQVSWPLPTVVIIVRVWFLL